MGWNGVEVGKALGFAVTSTSAGGAASAEGSEQAVRRKKKNVKRKMERLIGLTCLGCIEIFIR